MVVSVVLLIALTLAAALFPPLALACFALTASVSDAWGVSSYLRSVGLEEYVTFSRGPLLLAMGVSVALASRNRRAGRLPRAVWHVVALLAAATFWVIVAAAMRGEEAASIPGIVAYSGLPAGAIILAYWRSRWARRVLIAALLIQSLLAALIVAFPASPLAVVSGTAYESAEANASSIERRVEFASLEGRAFAQHYNPHAAGLYALAATVAGACLLIGGRDLLSRTAGGLLFPLGVYGWLVTVSRGATVGVGLALAIVVARTEALRTIKSRLVFAAGAFMLVAVAAVLLFTDVGDRFADVFTTSVADENLTTRLDAFGRALGQIASHPMFGVRSEELMAGFGLTAHQLPVSLAAAHGLFVGVVAGVILGYLAIRSCFRLPPMRLDLATAILLSGLTLGMGLTNNAAAPLLFWSCVAAACDVFLRLPRGRSNVESLRLREVKSAKDERSFQSSAAAAKVVR